MNTCEGLFAVDWQINYKLSFACIISFGVIGKEDTYIRLWQQPSLMSFASGNNRIPLAKTNAPHTLHRSIMRLVMEGFNIAIELQKRQCTVRSHESIIDMLLYYNIPYLSYIYSAKRISPDNLICLPCLPANYNFICDFHLPAEVYLWARTS